MNNSIEIFVATHKKFKNYDLEGYIPIQVGAIFTDNRFGYICDDIKDNISSKNKNYCELTALYWAWRNSSSTIKGLCHYRRYLSIKNISINKKYFLKIEEIKDDLKQFDIIIPEKRILKGRTCKENYLLGEGIEKDLVNLGKVIREKYPEYEEYYTKLLNGNECSYCNVMIANKDIFDSYCEWLFTLLFELEKITDISYYSSAQARVYGYLSELLLNVWINKNNLKVKYYPLINTEAKRDYKYYIKLLLEKVNLFKFMKQMKNRF